MGNYVAIIKSAIFAFPLVAFIFTIPFILQQYHRYGAINRLRVLIIYSFILYMLTAYFLVILPLPEISTVTKAVKPQFIPFRFIYDIITQTSLKLDQPSTYLTFWTDNCVFTVLFNLLLTVPFGIYMRYYYKCDLAKVSLNTFLLSLFYEVTQFTGLYFIYPYSYRIADVDDLIINTLGGILGYFIFGIFSRWLPSRDKIDEKAYEAGQHVSGFRRFCSFIVDMFIFIVIFMSIYVFYQKAYVGCFVFIFYYILIPCFNKGQTLAQEFLNIKVVFRKHLIFGNIVRNLIIALYYFVIPFIILLAGIKLRELITIDANLLLVLCFIVLFNLLAFYAINIVVVIRNKGIFYDRMLKCHFENTIKVPTKEEEAQSQN